MIKSETIKIKKTDIKSDNLEIENKLSTIGYEPIRWAITNVDDDTYYLDVSYKLI